MFPLRFFVIGVDGGIHSDGMYPTGHIPILFAGVDIGEDFHENILQQIFRVLFVASVAHTTPHQVIGILFVQKGLVFWVALFALAH